jgi:hypothetical protein
MRHPGRLERVIIRGVRRVSAWLVVIPTMLAGTEVAHALAYRIVYPEASVRWRVLAETGHGYLGWTPVFLGVGAAIVLAGLASSVFDAVRREPPRPTPAWVFGLLPLAGFTLQEFLERWLVSGSLPWWMVEQPTFRVGLLLQLPFSLVAFLAASLLLRAARRVGSILGAARSPLAHPASRMRWHRFALAALQPCALGAGHDVRGPPPAFRRRFLPA